MSPTTGPFCRPGRKNTTAADPAPAGAPARDEQGETFRLARFDPGCRVPAHDHEGEEEIFVIEGDLTDEHGTYPAGTWLRQPDGSFHDPVSPGGVTLFVKRGHLLRL